MTDHTLDVAALVSSRICHDLISPVGAIRNGIELMSLQGDNNSPEFELLSGSVEGATAKLRFIRLAYGGAAHGALMPAIELENILNDYLGGNRCQLDFKLTGKIARPHARVIALLISCQLSTLPRGGKIKVTNEGEGIGLQASAQTIKPDQRLWDHANGHRYCEALRASEIHFELARAAIAAEGIEMATAFSDDIIEVELKFHCATRNT